MVYSYKDRRLDVVCSQFCGLGQHRRSGIFGVLDAYASHALMKKGATK